MAGAGEGSRPFDKLRTGPFGTPPARTALQAAGERGYYMAPKLGTVVKTYRKEFRHVNRPDIIRELVSYTPGS